MKKLKYIITCLIIAIFSLLELSVISNAASANSSSSISIGSPSCILIEASTGKILYEKNAKEVRYPASTTKIMTAIVVLENCKLTDVATVSHNAIYSIPADYVTANLKEGEELTVEQLLNVLLIPSANDAAIVLAEHVSGSVSKFADLMNKKAKEIGCQNTHFVNPNGVHNKEHVSTAYDLSLIAKYAMQNNTFRGIVKKTKYFLPATNKYTKTDRIFTTTNSLLIKNTSQAKSNYYYANATGVKTGYTEEAGNCLVSSAKKDNMEVISVVLGAGSTKEGLSEKFLDSITLLDYALEHYAIKTLQEKDTVLQEVKVAGATKETQNLKVAVKNDIEILMGDDTNPEELHPNVSLNNLKAPIMTGDVVGKITYTFDGETYSSELIAHESVMASSFFPILLRICLIVITLYLLYLLLKPSKKNKKKQHKKKSHHNSKSKKSSKKNKKGGNYRNTIINNL